MLNWQFCNHLIVDTTFFDIESLNFFDQLSRICTTFQQNQNLLIFQIINNLHQIVQVLNNLNVQFFVAVFQ